MNKKIKIAGAVTGGLLLAGAVGATILSKKNSGGRKINLKKFKKRIGKSAKKPIKILKNKMK